MVLCSRAAQEIKKDKKRNQEAGPFCRMASGPASFCLKNHLQNPLLEILQEIPCIFRVTLEEKIIGIESEIYRKRAERSGASAIPRPRNFLIFPLPFLIFSRAPEHDFVVGQSKESKRTKREIKWQAPLPRQRGRLSCRCLAVSGRKPRGPARHFLPQVWKKSSRLPQHGRP